MKNTQYYESVIRKGAAELYLQLRETTDAENARDMVSRALQRLAEEVKAAEGNLATGLAPWKIARR